MNRCKFYYNILKCLKFCTTVYMLTQITGLWLRETKSVTALFLVTSLSAQRFHNHSKFVLEASQCESKNTNAIFSS